MQRRQSDKRRLFAFRLPASKGRHGCNKYDAYCLLKDEAEMATYIVNMLIINKAEKVSRWKNKGCALVDFNSRFARMANMGASLKRAMNRYRIFMIAK